MDIVGALFCLLIIYGAYAWGPNGTLRMQIILQLFGGTTALALGGPVIVVPIFCLPFLIAWATKEVMHHPRWWVIPRANFYLGAAIFIGGVLAFTVPRVFEGEFLVMPLKSGALRTVLTPIGPVSGNITQTGYAIGNLFAFCAGRTLLTQRGGIRAYQEAMLHLSALICFTGFLSIFEFYTKIPSLLDVFRTAYATTHQAFGNMARIAGTYPETSTYSSVCLSMLGFCSQLWLHQVKTHTTRPLTIVLLLLLLLTTSGTAYAGLVLYSGFFAFSVARKIRTHRAPPIVSWILVCFLAGCCLACAAVAFDSVIITILSDFIDEAVLTKLSSDSGQERGNWNYYGIQSFLNTYGLGVGFGTITTSSLIVTVISNLGVLGGLAYCLFLYETLRPAASWQSQEVFALSTASRHGLIASLCAASLSATTFSLFVNVYLFAAMASLGRYELIDKEDLQ